MTTDISPELIREKSVCKDVWPVGWSVNRSVSWSDSRLVVWSIGTLVHQSFGPLVGQSVGWSYAP